MPVLQTLFERLTLVSLFLLLIASSRSHPVTSGLPHSKTSIGFNTYLCLNMVQVFLASIEVMLVFTTVEAAVTAGVTQAALLTTSR